MLTPASVNAASEPVMFPADRPPLSKPRLIGTAEAGAPPSKSTRPPHAAAAENPRDMHTPAPKRYPAGVVHGIVSFSRQRPATARPGSGPRRPAPPDAPAQQAPADQDDQRERDRPADEHPDPDREQAPRLETGQRDADIDPDRQDAHGDQRPRPGRGQQGGPETEEHRHDQRGREQQPEQPDVVEHDRP